ncbi:MAG: cupredoxin domain-containing protein [Actinomycetota bacterium]
MRRSIALVLAASLFLVMTEQAHAATVDISIVSASAGFDPKATAGAFGDTFHWTNDDTITHTTTQNAPLSLWNSGHLNGGSSFSKAINFAGSYPYHCTIHLSMTGTIKARIQVTPTSGSVGTTFAAVVASVAAPSGSVYDIQRKKGSGDWTAWKTGITSKSVTFRPKASGTWSFRSRLRKTSNGAKSGWSPARSISVM